MRGLTSARRRPSPIAELRTALEIAPSRDEIARVVAPAALATTRLAAYCGPGARLPRLLDAVVDSTWAGATPAAARGPDFPFVPLLRVDAGDAGDADGTWRAPGVASLPGRHGGAVLLLEVGLEAYQAVPERAAPRRRPRPPQIADTAPRRATLYMSVLDATGHPLGHAPRVPAGVILLPPASRHRDGSLEANTVLVIAPEIRGLGIGARLLLWMQAQVDNIAPGSRYTTAGLRTTQAAFRLGVRALQAQGACVAPETLADMV